MFQTTTSAYRDAAVNTADPAKLLVMLCQRLQLDAQRALAALRDDAHQTAHNELLHAQAIVNELRHSLNPDGFSGGHQLAALYDYIHDRLVQANIRKDLTIAEECVTLCTGISEMWTEAAVLSMGVSA